MGWWGSSGSYENGKAKVSESEEWTWTLKFILKFPRDRGVGILTTGKKPLVHLNITIIYKSKLGRRKEKAKPLSSQGHWKLAVN